MKRLGLDIGTNSIGWCLVEYSTKHANGERIVDIGSRIFSDGRVPKSGESLAVGRRIARGMRRRRDRYLGRRSAFLKALIEHGLMPEDSKKARLIAECDPYPLRARALDEKLEPYEIGRALFHLNQRRGFKSNRKAERKEGEGGKIYGGAKKLDTAMEEVGARTLGEFLNARPTKRVRMGGEDRDYDFYPQRHHIEQEFAAIWSKQADYHPSLLTEIVRAALHRILFFQRPLKEQEVGACTFLTDEKRLPKAHPLFQERRLYEEVNHLAVTTPGEASRPLTKHERDTLILHLRNKKSSSFSALAKKLKLDPGQSFNKASETRTKLAGNEIYAVMSHKALFSNRWAHFDMDRRWQIVDRLLNEEDPPTLHAFLIEECGLEEDRIEAAEKATRSLPEGYGRLGPTATRRILDKLKQNVITYDKAVELCGWHHSDHRTGEILSELPYYGELLTREIPPGTQKPNDPPEKRWGKITNPTVHIGLRQIEKLVNAIIKVHGRPDEIVVELARELKLSEKQKDEQNKRIRETTKAAERRSKTLQEESIRDTGANRMLLRIWEELNPDNILDRRCSYCGDAIELRALFSGEVDIDHILPYSRTLDDSVSNKTVSHRHCNRQKGNKTPWEKWGETERWDVITEQVARLHKGKQWRFQPDAMERFEDEEGFIQRQLTDTQYLARMAGRYLSSLYPSKEDGSVYVIPGRMTAMLRRLWGLNSLLPDHNFVDNEHSNAPKNRLDHRHHAIDAAVVAVTTRGLLNEVANAAGRAENDDLDRMFKSLPQPWEGFREELGEKVMRVTVSHKADHGRKGKPPKHRDATAAQLHNETAYGFTGEYAADGKTPIVVHRVALTSLKPGDLMNSKRIPDETLRNKLNYSTKGLSGKDFEKALVDFAKTDPIFKGIRRIRVREALGVIPIRDATGTAYKGYKGDSNARFDVWRLPNGKWKSDTVPMFDAHQLDQSDRRPHPAAKKVLSLRQNDMLAIEHEGNPALVVRVVKFSSNGSIALAPDNEAGALKARDAASTDEDPFRYINSSGGGLKKRKARQVRVDPLGRVFDPGPRE
uniref:type II CRISPR RNA-guided endonuclease Cas9 n=1 Tax=uncultured Erythrobacter sp. TaxID=263913 RepID=UPI002604C3AB|nr:type II CRISPR RNA-guided endonuclease Cas9 [uncultured Erythrobacter sp.]